MTEVFWQPGISLEQVEKQVILKALNFFQGDKARTAKALNIEIAFLESKLEIYNGTVQSSPEPGIGSVLRLRTKEAEDRGRIAIQKLEREELEQRAKIQTEKAQEFGKSPDAGVQMEPVRELPQKQSMPVRKRG